MIFRSHDLDLERRRRRERRRRHGDGDGDGEWISIVEGTNRGVKKGRLKEPAKDKFQPIMYVTWEKRRDREAASTRGIYKNYIYIQISTCIHHES